MDSSYLDDLYNTLTNNNICVPATKTTARMEALADSLYQRLLILHNPKKYQKLHPGEPKKFEYNYNNNKLVSFTVFYKDVTFLRVYRGTKINKTTREQLVSHLNNTLKHTTKDNRYNKLISFLIYDLYTINQIPFPKHQSNSVTTLEELYDALYNTQLNIVLTLDDTWQNICEDKKKLCFYL